MAFHNRAQHGPMKQKTIVTQIIGDKENGMQEACDKHDKIVNKFNNDHEVFFNTSYGVERFGDSLVLCTVCLYVDLKTRPMPSGLPPLN